MKEYNKYIYQDLLRRINAVISRNEDLLNYISKYTFDKDILYISFDIASHLYKLKLIVENELSDKTVI